MTNTPSPTDEDRELIARLRKVKSSVYVRHTAANTFLSNTVYENPAGPKAAARLESLLADRAKLEEALKPFAEHPDFHASDGWAVTIIDETERTPGVTAGDFRRARAVLNRSGDVILSIPTTGRNP